jgi:hypothetical protein
MEKYGLLNINKYLRIYIFSYLEAPEMLKIMYTNKKLRDVTKYNFNLLNFFKKLKEYKSINATYINYKEDVSIIDFISKYSDSVPDNDKINASALFIEYYFHKYNCGRMMIGEKEIDNFDIFIRILSNIEKETVDKFVFTFNQRVFEKKKQNKNTINNMTKLFNFVKTIQINLASEMEIYKYLNKNEKIQLNKDIKFKQYTEDISVSIDDYTEIYEFFKKYPNTLIDFNSN